MFPAVEEQEPELILISAGFDAHARDPLANLEWRTEDFGWVTAAAVRNRGAARGRARGLDTRGRL